MTSRLLIIAALFCLAVPAAIAAPPAGKGKPEKQKPAPSAASSSSQAAEKNASKACKAERGTTAESIAAFNTKYGKNANLRNAHGKCVSTKVKQQQAAAQAQAEKNAAKKCKAERGTTQQTIDAFNTRYGTNANKRNAFGKCVSTLAKQQGSS